MKRIWLQDHKNSNASFFDRPSLGYGIGEFNISDGDSSVVLSDKEGRALAEFILEALEEAFPQEAEAFTRGNL